MFEKLKFAFHEAKTKATTYVGLAIASSAEIRDQWPQIAVYTKGHPTLEWLSSHTYVVLGLLVVYTRIRRALGNSAGDQSK